jgi:hypothetical protein
VYAQSADRGENCALIPRETPARLAGKGIPGDSKRLEGPFLMQFHHFHAPWPGRAP